MTFKNIEKQFIDLVNHSFYDEALIILDETPELISKPSVNSASCISFLLILSNEIETCISFCSHHIRNIPSADFHFNYAYALELIGNNQMAISHYSCAKMFSMDLAFREQIRNKILLLKYPKATEEEHKLLSLYHTQEREYIKLQLLNHKQDINPNDYIKTPFPLRTRISSIFLGTTEIANHIAHYLKYFKSIGINAIGVNYKPNYLNYECDFNQDLSKISPNNTKEHYLLNAIDFISEYDIFHFIFNCTLMPDSIDLIPLRKLNKNMFMHNLGSEIRLPEIALTHHKYWAYAIDYLNTLDVNLIKHNVRVISSWIPTCIINDYEMKSYVENHYQKIHMIGLPIDLDKYKFRPQIKRELIHIVHAPTNKSVKGSKYFEQAIRQLSFKYQIKYTKIENMSHERAMVHYRDADIVLDELIIGTYGSLTIECMAMGRCVATFINPSFPTPHNEEIPVWNVNIDNLYDRLELLIASFELRKELSLKARNYVEKNNDFRKIGSELLRIYQNKN